MGKTTENIEYYLNQKSDKDYLQDLVLNLKEAYENQENMTFKIIEAKEKGFVVKVGGLFAFVSFRHFCWSYYVYEYWKNVSPYVVNYYFSCKIHQLYEKPIYVQIDGKQHHFEKIELEKYTKYRGVIAHKSKIGFYIDIGLHFNWKFGSLLGLYHKSALISQDDYDNYNAGDEITTLYHGKNKNGKILLGDNKERAKWLNGELRKLPGTIQKVNVVINENDKPEFYVLGEHKARIPVLKEYYPNYKTTIKKYIYGLKDGETIECEVVKMNKRKNCFILRLLIEPPTN